ncbi:MAG TPA: L-threonine 3-dehydrogenase [Planctomycetia bacterium]|nr:L-threonine 3-dehydrogenase [Planctomycetia bacterium]
MAYSEAAAIPREKLPAGIPTQMSGIKKLKSEPGLDWVDGIATPLIGPTDVLIKVTHAGICGTDRHIYEWDPWAASRVKTGVTCGHEFVGRIVAIGSACRHRKVGERVSAEGHISCGQCPACRQGDAHICHFVDILGIDCDGCFAEYVAVPEYNAWPVPEAIPDKVAAIFDPLGNAMHTVMAAGVSGKNVLVTGAGIIGLMAVSIAKHAGAGSILVTDLDERRLKIARDLGADETFLASDSDWVQRARRATRGHGVDVLLEMSGSGKAISDGFDALRNGGTAALLGLPARPVSLDLPNQVIFKGATILGINGRRMFETWYQVERFLLKDRIHLDQILTHVIPWRNYHDGFKLMQSGDGIKIVLDMGAGK